jgi:hypothetical protein
MSPPGIALRPSSPPLYRQTRPDPLLCAGMSEMLRECQMAARIRTNGNYTRRVTNSDAFKGQWRGNKDAVRPDMQGEAPDATVELSKQ